MNGKWVLVLITVLLLVGTASAAYVSFEPTMTTNSTPSGNNTYAKSEYDPGSRCYRVYDDSYTYGWSSDGNVPQWITLQTSGTHIVTNYTISSSGTAAPKNWTFAGSTDNTSWTTLDTQVSKTSWTSVNYTYNFSNTNAYDYFNLTITAVNGEAYVDITEVVLYESDDIAPVAGFSVTPISSVYGTDLTATFTNTSLNNPTSWEWYYSKYTGTTEGADVLFNNTSATPTQVFTAGNYNIKLKATNSMGSDWENKSSVYSYGYIHSNLYYYAYGDSITSAIWAPYDYLTKTALHDPDNGTHIYAKDDSGSGQTSTWAIANVQNYPTGKYQIIEFGTNDRIGGTPGLTTAENYETLYNMYLANGSIPVIITTFPFNEATPADYNVLANEQANETIIQNYLDSKSIPYVTIFDSIDLTQNNDVFDGYNTTNYDDGNIVHPNAAGHTLMADYLWDYLSTREPVAAFTTNTSYGTYRQTFQFTDTSTNIPDSWSWEFTNNTPGNNTPIEFSTSQHPSYTFGQGCWTIELNATNDIGSDTETSVIKVFDKTDGGLLLPANHIYNYNISSLPIHANSTTWLGSFTTLRYYSYPINYVDSTVTPLIDVDFSFPLVSDDGAIYPVHNSTNIEGGSDKHALVYETDTNQIYEIYQLTKVTATHFDGNMGLKTNLSSNALEGVDGAGYISNTIASGSYLFPALIRYDEVMNVSINHATSCSVAHTNYSYLWPGRNTGESAHNTSIYPPMGARLRLNSSVDISSFDPKSQIVLNGLKNYGCFIDDQNGGTGTFEIRFAQDPRWDVDPTGGSVDIGDLADGLDGSDFEFVDESALMVDPDSGETATTVTPVAAFTANDTAVCVDEAVMFNDTSIYAPTAWHWIMYPGGWDSHYQNFTHAFDAAGLYSVNLTATNADGSDSENKTDYINVTECTPVANFTANVTECYGFGGCFVQFTDTSTNSPDEWSWEIEDGSSAAGQNPVVLMYHPGNWNVKLKATRYLNGFDWENKTDYIRIGDPFAPVTDFSANSTINTTPLYVQFTDLSTNVPTEWYWYFWDNETVSSTDMNPTGTFTTPGFYDIRLNASNVYGPRWMNKTDYLYVGDLAEPVANFTADAVDVCPSTWIQFTDRSTNVPTDWYWDISPGITSVDQDPRIEFNVAGIYNVNMSATNAYGANWSNNTGYINVSSTFCPPASALSTATIVTAIVGGLALVGITLMGTGAVLLIRMFRPGIISRGGSSSGGGSAANLGVGVTAIAVGAMLLMVAYIILGPLITIAGL